jgi:ubiquitin C-terminal hydrolase
MRKDEKGKALPGQLTFVDDIFGAKLVSSVICDCCKHISTRLEDFLDISLPVSEEKKAGVCYSLPQKVAL